MFKNPKFSSTETSSFNIYGGCHVSGHTKIYGGCHVSGHTKIYGGCHVSGHTKIYGGLKMAAELMAA
jgi:UDP-3-O-[3-hydroxymyristoyl] glucosamine N-acyltransferase